MSEMRLSDHLARSYHLLGGHYMSAASLIALGATSRGLEGLVALKFADKRIVRGRNTSQTQYRRGTGKLEQIQKEG